jgi:hypothetical protein
VLSLARKLLAVQQRYHLHDPAAIADPKNKGNERRFAWLVQD